MKMTAAYFPERSLLLLLGTTAGLRAQQQDTSRLHGESSSSCGMGFEPTT